LKIGYYQELITNYRSLPTHLNDILSKTTDTKPLKDEDKEGGKRVVSWLTLQAEHTCLVNMDLDYS